MQPIDGGLWFLLPGEVGVDRVAVELALEISRDWCPDGLQDCRNRRAIAPRASCLPQHYTISNSTNPAPTRVAFPGLKECRIVVRCRAA